MVNCVFGEGVASPCPVLESFKQQSRVKDIEYGILSGFCQVCPYLKNYTPPIDIKIWQPGRNKERPEEQ